MNFKLGKSKDNKKKSAEEEGDNLVMQISDMEKQFSKKAADSGETEDQLRPASINTDDLTAAPHKPVSELTLDPGEVDDSVKEAIIPPADELDDIGGEEIKLVEIGAEELAKAKEEKSAPDAPKEPEATEVETESIVGAPGSLNDLFSDDDDEVNPLTSLINALPDVTVKELLDDLQEISEIINERTR